MAFSEDSFASNIGSVPCSPSFRSSGYHVQQTPSISESGMPSPDFAEVESMCSAERENSAFPSKRRRVAQWSQLHPVRSFEERCQVMDAECTPDHSPSTKQHRITAPERDLYINVPALQDFHNLNENIHQPYRTEQAVLVRESIFGRTPKEEREAHRLVHLFDVLQHSACSRADCRHVFRYLPAEYNLTYDSLRRYMVHRAGIKMQFVASCPDGHMAASGDNIPGMRCLVGDCHKVLSTARKFFYIRPSEMFRALCIEQVSFRQLYHGCCRAQDAVANPEVNSFFDFYHGRSFQRQHSERLCSWRSSTELFIFISMSTDGVEIGKRGSSSLRSFWPIMITVLNLDVSYRFRACNVLVPAVVPGLHSANHFDSFFQPIYDDLEALQDKVSMMCWDGIVRKVFVFVLFVTADWPAATKLGGFVGHKGRKCCRYCEKTTSASVLMPTGSLNSRKRAIDDDQYCGWIDDECPKPRTNATISKAWDDIDAAKRVSCNLKLRSLIKDTGIKRRPIIAGILPDFVNSFPFDTMHLCLSGLVSLMVRLVFGLHDRLRDTSSFVLPCSEIDRINRSMLSCATGFPKEWGRFPLSFDQFSSYKAENIKNLALYHVVPIVSQSGCSRDMLDLWVTLRKVLFIVMDPTPESSAVHELRVQVQRLHALYAKNFHVDEYHSFVFTPSTHAFLHLPHMLEENGPLLNVSHFLAERVIGELVRYAKSPTLLESSLLNSFLFRFGTQMLLGGLRKGGARSRDSSTTPISPANNGEAESRTCSETEDSVSSFESSDSDGEWRTNDDALWVLKGSGRAFSSNSDLVEGLQSIISPHLTSLDIAWIHAHERAVLADEHKGFSVEVKSRYLKRHWQQSRKGFVARQGYWIAANYVSNCSVTLTDTYYGCILCILEVGIRVHNGYDQCESIQPVKIVQIEWQNGLSVNYRNETVSTKLRAKRRRGSILDTQRTFERLSCVDRQIGYFDHGGLRYFLDNAQRLVFGDRSFTIRGCC